MKTNIPKPRIRKIVHERRHIVGLSIFWLFLIVVILQLLYPTSRATIFAAVDGIQVGSKSTVEIHSLLQQRYDKEVQFSVLHDKLTRAKLSDAGITPRYDSTVDRVVNYSFWQRLIPFSLFTKQLFEQPITTEYRVDPAKVKIFVATKIMPLCSQKPINAQLQIKAGEVKLVGGSTGRECDAVTIERQLQRVSLGEEVILPAKIVQPTKSRAALEPLLTLARQRLDKGISLKVGDQVKAIDRAVLASWLLFQEDSKTHVVKIGVRQDKITAYVQNLDKTFRRDARPTQIYLVDGKVRRQVKGSEGRALDIARTVNDIKRLILKADAPESTVVVQSVRITPGTEYIRDYGGTQQGLTILLEDLVREKGLYGITVTELGGKQRRANVNGTHIFTTASTYKMFVAYSVLKEIEAGRIKWNQQIRDGMTTVACFDEMILYSLNPCSWTFRDMVGGWARIQQQMRSLGLTNTYLVQNDLRSTSNDEALFLQKLEQGTSLTGASRDFLLRMFREQRYRSGIPSGVQWQVANKIGFLDGYLHDVAIVYSPKGTYILAVMTYGGSWWQIADVAKRVDVLMQR